MLELRPTCEHCNCPLPADSTDAMICTFECTFCRDCVERVLENVCPNCGGGFVARPIRPVRNWTGGNNLAAHPASTREVHKPVDPVKHGALRAKVKEVPPEDR